MSRRRDRKNNFCQVTAKSFFIFFYLLLLLILIFFTIKYKGVNSFYCIVFNFFEITTIGLYRFD